MKKIVIFASGSGTNAENIIRYFKGSKTICIPFILSNKANAYVHQRAAAEGVPSFTYTKEEFNNGTVLRLLQENEIEFIVLAGFMLKISDDFLAAYPNKIVNIHPSLLPKYGGKGMHGDLVHQAVVAAGEKETGITIHYLNDQYDSGQIVFQAKCPVLPTDTPEQVATKVHALEYKHFPAVIEELVMHL